MKQTERSGRRPKFAWVQTNPAIGTTVTSRFAMPLNLAYWHARRLALEHMSGGSRALILMFREVLIFCSHLPDKVSMATV